MLKQLLAISVSIIVLMLAQTKASSLSANEVDKLPDEGAIGKLASQPVSQSYIDALLSAMAPLRDYQCFCQMMVVKNNKWKDFGGANLFFKQNQKFRAEVVSSDYRNGSVVVKQADGKIRGKGGGGLSLIKMTMQPDSRNLRLPTGFSLAQSDFASLYGNLKGQLAPGVEATATQPTNIPVFKDPVQVLSVRRKGEGLIHVIYLNPRTKTPLVWNTFANGQSNAVASFDRLDVNKGLTDDLFQL